jgi:hypothetical protein
VDRHQWFFDDEWGFLLHRGLSARQLLTPHNQHWSTVPVLVYRALFALVGLHSYLPYLAVLFALHLVLAHLLWRAMRAVGADPLVATGLAAGFAVFGAGSEDLVWAFQMGFVGAVLLGWAFVLLAAGNPASSGVSRTRERAAWAASLGALLFSGVGPIMVATGGLAVLLRRGLRQALRAVAPAALAYSAWLGAYGASRVTPGIGVGRLVAEMPGYVGRGLQATFGEGAGAQGAGLALMVLLGAWLVWHLDLARTRAAPAFAGALGAVGFFVVVSVGRARFGAVQAASSRYVYVAAALVLPAVALAASSLLAAAGGLGGRARRLVAAPAEAVVLVGLLAWCVVEAAMLARNAAAVAGRAQRLEGQILAAAAIGADAPTLPGARPEPTFAPALTLAGLERLRAEGKLPALTLTPADLLAAATRLELAWTPRPLLPVAGSPPRLVGASGAAVAPLDAGRTPPDLRPGPTQAPSGACVEVHPTAPVGLVALVTPEPRAFELLGSGRVAAYLQVAGVVVPLPLHPPIHARLSPTTPRYLDDAASADQLVVALPAGHPAVLCG